ncbi:MAG: metallophosphoesterase [Bacteroidota bacterium]
MKNKPGRRYSRFLFPGLVIVLVSVLYFALLTALPKYAGRVPFLAILFLIDWIVYRDVRRFWLKYSVWIRAAFAVFWWLPVSLLFIFLIGSVFMPLQQWNDFLRIYLPGIALITIMSKIAMFAGLLPAYLIRMLSYISGLFRKKGSFLFPKTERFFRITGLLLAGILLILMTIGSVYWVYRFRVHHVEISLAHLPKQFEGLRIVQLSDIHLGSWVSTRPLQRAVDQVMALKPDLIVFTGDMVNYSTSEVSGFESTLSQLKAPLGVFAILGNHDYGDYTAWESDSAKRKNLLGLFDFYRQIGWKLLRNESELIMVDSASLLIAGVENWSATSRFKKYGDMVTTLNGISFADINILLSHDPTHWDAEVTDTYPQFDLTLSGHTHGMQMGIETSWLKWSPSQYMYKEWAGLYPFYTSGGEVSYLYINRGLGHIGYPGRVGILPEITLIRLHRK